MTHHAVSMVAREQAELVAVSAPGDLGPNEIRGRTLHSLISPGTELAGKYTGSSFPSFSGYAATFAVEEVGVDVEGVTAGETYFCMGSHRSYQQVDVMAAHWVPMGLPSEMAVLARLMGVSMTTLMTTSARPGDRVLVTGAGPVGFLAAQMFQLSGYEVVVVEPNETRRREVEQAGLAPVLGAVPCDDTSLVGTVALALECSGHERAVLEACQLVRKRGEVVLIGVPWRRQTDDTAHELLSLVFHKYVVLRSGWEWELPHHSSDYSPHSIHSGFNRALRWLADGRIKVGGLITRASPVDAQQTYQDLLHRRAKGLFPVFDWTEITLGR